MMLKISGVEDVIKHVEKVRNSLPSKEKLMLERLADIGVQTAGIKFVFAQYDGFNDVVVDDPKWVDDHTIRITASGQAVGFIEFGTGITYTEVHPEAARFGAVRGGYGLHRGLRKAWGYYGDPGTNGEEKVTKSGNVVVVTHGNPPARAMYDAGKEIRLRILEIAKEVFKNDRL